MTISPSVFCRILAESVMLKQSLGWASVDHISTRRTMVEIAFFSRFFLLSSRTFVVSFARDAFSSLSSLFNPFFVVMGARACVRLEVYVPYSCARDYLPVFVCILGHYVTRSVTSYLRQMQIGDSATRKRNCKVHVK